MKYQKMKVAAVILCVLAAGVCYGLNKGPDREVTGIVLSGEETAGTEEAGSFDGTEQEIVLDGDGGRSPGLCYVHICGEVVSPGVYELEEGSRVFQAVERAGGFTQAAAPEALNMAERVADGMKVLVLSKSQVLAAGGSLPVNAGAGVSGSKVNINTAGTKELMTLKGIGASRAEDIVNYRESHGRCGKIEDIMKVSGIKDGAFQKIKEEITVS